MMIAKISRISSFQLPKKLPNITKITDVGQKFQICHSEQLFEEV